MGLRFWAGTDPARAGQTPATAHHARNIFAEACRSRTDAAGAVVHGDPRLHERDQPAGAGQLDHAGQQFPPTRCWSICCIRRLRPAALQPSRRRTIERPGQRRCTPACSVAVRMVRHLPATVPQVSCLRTLLASGLAADVAADRHRRADLDLLPAGIRPVRRRWPFDRR